MNSAKLAIQNRHKLSNGQVSLLETIKPLTEWINELYQLEDFDDFGAICKAFPHYMTYDQFYYAGVDQTPKVSPDDPRVVELYGYKEILFKVFKNMHYRSLVNRLIKNFIIGHQPFDSVKSRLLELIDQFGEKATENLGYDSTISDEDTPPRKRMKRTQC